MTKAQQAQHDAKWEADRVRYIQDRKAMTDAEKVDARRESRVITSLRLEIPLLPPTVNHYVKHTRFGRHYMTSEGKSYKAAISLVTDGRTLIPGDPKALKKTRYKLDTEVFLGPKQRGDVDNFCKCIADGLVDAGVIHSDAAIDEWNMRKNTTERISGRTVITVEILKDDAK